MRRLFRHHVFTIVVASIVVCLYIVLNYCDRPTQFKSAFVDANALMEVVIPDELRSQMVSYPGFIVSYNADYHQPNYVVWELLESEVNGEWPRERDFMEDESVIGSATLADYRRSGYDRGHMIPAADVKWSKEAMKSSHFLTNICPQDHRLNAGAWAVLEDNCRTWACRDSALIIICGPVLTDSLTRTIGKDNVIPVPERYFKVVLAPFVNPPRGIGFLMYNGRNDGGVQSTVVSIDQVEDITGFDFFSILPDDMENEVESQCSYHYWQRKQK